MIPLIESLRRSVPGVIGKELLSELWSAPWDSPMFKNIEGAGLALGTSTGSHRSRNEDRVAVAHVTSLSHDQYTVAVVCDGVGGSEMGDVAATLVIATLVGELSLSRGHPPLATLLTDLIRKADDSVRLELDGRGTTTASVVIASSSGQFAATNIGDSRIFSWNPGAAQLVQVSVDDTMENEFRDLPLKDDSVLAARGLRGRLSQALGESGRSSDDLKIVVYGKDRFPKGAVLATDGAWKADPVGFERIVSHANSSAEAVRRVLAFSGWVGGLDNVSVIVVEDVVKFAKYSVIPMRLSSKAAWATVWIGDSKFVACDSAPLESSTPQKFEARDAQLKPTPERMKTKRKPQARRKAGVSATEAGKPQLDLGMERARHNETGGGRPKVEVSTDDDTPKV